MTSSTKAQYHFWIRLASTAAVLAAVMMISLKFYAWMKTDSASMLASLTDSFFDVAASLFNFFVLRYSLTPADDEHRFGHGKAESLAGLAQAAFILGSATLLIIHGISRLNHSTPIHNIELGIQVSVASIVITFALVMIQLIAIRKTQSSALKADSLHYRSDLLLNLSVVVALWLTQQGFHSSDAWFSIAIALYLLWGAWQVAQQSIQSIMDRELPELEQQQIFDICLQVEGVKGMHDLRTRQAGHTKFIQLHLELDDELSLIQAHGIADRVEHSLLSAFPEADIIIHMDPLSLCVSEPL